MSTFLNTPTFLNTTASGGARKPRKEMDITALMLKSHGAITALMLTFPVFSAARTGIPPCQPRSMGAPRSPPDLTTGADG